MLVRINLVHRSHQFAELGKLLLAAIVLVDDPGAGRRDAALALALPRQFQPLVFAEMVVKPETAALPLTRQSVSYKRFERARWKRGCAGCPGFLFRSYCNRALRFFVP